MVIRRKVPAARKRLRAKQLGLFQKRRAAMAMSRQDLVQAIVGHLHQTSECCEQVEERLDKIEDYLSDATPDQLWAWLDKLRNDVNTIKVAIGMGGGTVPPPPKFP